jgi:hypothetical protein
LLSGRKDVAGCCTSSIPWCGLVTAGKFEEILALQFYKKVYLLQCRKISEASIIKTFMNLNDSIFEN